MHLKYNDIALSLTFFKQAEKGKNKKQKYNLYTMIVTETRKLTKNAKLTIDCQLVLCFDLHV